MMRASQLWSDSQADKGQPQCVHDMVYRPDGEMLFVTVGSRVNVYAAADGKHIQTLRGHKDTIYSVSCSRDGESVVSGGADKQVVIWGGQPYEGQLKYPHNEPLQKVAYNPVALQVLSCTASDIGLWTPEQKSVSKHKVSSRVCDCSWTNDGQYFALGHFDGNITIWTKSGEEKVKVSRPGGHPVWAVKWNPVREDQYDILAVCDWGQRMAFYQLNGRQIGKDRNVNFDVTSMKYFGTGDFKLITGTNKKATVFSFDGIQLGVVCETTSWTWSCCVRPGKNINQVAIGTEDGDLAVYQLAFPTVHGMYQEKYAYRDKMTAVVVQQLSSNQSTRIRCHDLVKKIAIYKDKLAVQLTDKINVYELTDNELEELKYVLQSRFPFKEDCNLLVMTSSSVIVCKQNNLHCISLDGEPLRDWSMDSQIRYIRVVSGPAGRESMLVGLRNGQVFRIFVNNSFPNFILKQQVSIRCLDLSLSRSKLAIVDESNVLMVYDMITKQLLYQEPNATSVCWNQAYEDMLCYSGSGCLNVKTSNFPVHQLRQQGFVVGFNGAKIFCLNYMTMSQVDVPQSVSMIQHLERKNYKDAYQIATLGVTEGDWKTLGIESLEGMDLEVAKKAFVHVKESRFLDLIHGFEERKRTGDSNTPLFLAEIFAYQGKFFEAAEVYKKCGAQQKAVEMFTELRDFELAKKFMANSSKDASDLIALQADWAMTTNDPQAACNMYVAAGNYQKAIQIMGDNGWIERLSSIFHDIPNSETEVLRQCADYLKQLGQPLIAAEVYEKMEDNWAHISLYIDLKQWDMAFLLAKKYGEHLNEVYLPYAFWLMENDRYDEAQEAMCKAGQENEALRMLEQLASNATKERRFGDTGYYYWLLAKSSLETASKLTDAEDVESLSDREKLVQKFRRCVELSECYHVYNVIHYFMEQPFTSFMPEALLNMSRFLTLRTLKNSPAGISKVFTLFTMAKQGKQLGAYKLARYAYDKLQSLHIPSNLQEAVELGHLTIRSKPYLDKEDLFPMCYRCSTTNPLINSVGNKCVNCKQPFEISFVSFEALPVVEFVLEEGISDDEAVKLINRDPLNKKSSSNEWKESIVGNAQTLRPSEQDLSVKDPMSAASYEMSDDFIPVVYGRSHLAALHRMEVIIKRWGPPIGNQYYKSIMPDMHITLCPGCNKMFHADDYELQVLSKGHCPFCRRKPPTG